MQLGRPIQLWGYQVSCRPMLRLPRFIALSYGSLGQELAGAMAATSTGAQSSCWSTRWSTRSQLQGCQSSRGPTRWRRVLFKSLQVVLSSNGLDFPWVASPAAGLCCSPPGNGSLQGRQSNRRPTRWRPICLKPSFLSRLTGCSDGQWLRLPRAVGAAAGRTRNRPAQTIVQQRHSAMALSPSGRYTLN